MLPGISGVMSGLPRIPAGTIIINDAAQEDTSNAASYTFSIDGGKAQSDRRIWLTIHHQEGSVHRTISSVTINGVSASGTQRGHNGGSTGLGAGVYSAVVPTGDGAMNAVVNYSGACTGCALDSVVGYGFAAAAHDTGTDETSGTANDVSVLIDTAANGIIIACFTGSSNTWGDRVTWTGATEAYDADFGLGSGFGTYSAAVETGTSSASGASVQAAVAAHADAGNDLVVVSWGLG